jgi:Cation transporter/ATPase, N-terminus
MSTVPLRLGTRVARPPVGQRPRAASREGPASPPFSAVPLDDPRRELGSDTSVGLSTAEAKLRLAEQEPNAIEPPHGHRGPRLLLTQFSSPITGILVAATVLSMVLGDHTDGVIILVIIAASGSLGCWQERNADEAVDALLARVRVHVEVMRDGREIAVPVEEVVAGDLVVLPLAGVLGLAAVLQGMLAALAGVTIGYIGVNELVKARAVLAA